MSHVEMNVGEDTQSISVGRHLVTLVAWSTVATQKNAAANSGRAFNIFSHGRTRVLLA